MYKFRFCYIQSYASKNKQQKINFFYYIVHKYFCNFIEIRNYLNHLKLKIYKLYYIVSVMTVFKKLNKVSTSTVLLAFSK